MAVTYSRARTPEEIERTRADNFNRSAGDLNEVDGYDCPVCRNKGVIMLTVDGPGGWWSTATKDCKCMKTRKTIRQMQRSGLKNVIRDLTFSKFEVTEPWQKTHETGGHGTTRPTRRLVLHRRTVRDRQEPPLHGNLPGVPACGPGSQIHALAR